MAQLERASSGPRDHVYKCHVGRRVGNSTRASTDFTGNESLMISPWGQPQAVQKGPGRFVRSPTLKFLTPRHSGLISQASSGSAAQVQGTLGDRVINFPRSEGHLPAPTNGCCKSHALSVDLKEVFPEGPTSMPRFTRNMVKRALRQHGIIPTLQRVEIALLMLSQYQHLSADQLGV
jgi:hypothetical protein